MKKKRVGWILALMCLGLLTGCSLSVNQNFAKQNLKNWNLHSKAARAHYEKIEDADTKRIRIQALDASIKTAAKAVKK